jgi:hypothetical protein
MLKEQTGRMYKIHGVFGFKNPAWTFRSDVFTAPILSHAGPMLYRSNRKGSVNNYINLNTFNSLYNVKWEKESRSAAYKVCKWYREATRRDGPRDNVAKPKIAMV